MLLLLAYYGRWFFLHSFPTAGLGLQANVDSGNLGGRIAKHGYQTRLKLSKFSSDRAVVGVDDNSSKPDIGNARLTCEWCHCLEKALKL